MRARPTVRVLVIDPAGRILLMKGRLPSDPEGPGVWFTLGGGIEPGESVAEAARREVAEESGLADLALGPELWRREAVYHDHTGEAWRFEETYLSAATAGGEASRAGWLAHERALVDDLRWWTLDELRATAEPFVPEQLVELMQKALAGNFQRLASEAPGRAFRGRGTTGNGRQA